MLQKKPRLTAETSLEDRKSDTESKANVLDNGAKNSSEVKKVYHVTLSELADILTENLLHKLQALPKRAISFAWKLQQIVSGLCPAQ